ncbi:MAG: MerR family transcriptional regulator [Sphaerochaetaceae bacterium]|jgi:MerR family copper efflux transcriptional regulator|nr:MerR family transcriptional regulator [Sphaerochaetaceae bacterium]MDD4007777.1 MerR family transcriptional regulator [Sphaerochaetaceae bacterium]MDD4397750.1 MerR family transcriptional regulator [Sphaerochaetaceae bacterium]
MEEIKGTLYRIGDLARKAGVTTRTVRYYEDLGLLKTKDRTVGGQRVYTDMDLVYLMRIMQLKGYGLSLDEISRIVKLGFEDVSGEKRRYELMAQYQNLIEREKETIRNHEELLRQLKWNISQLQNSKDGFRRCPGPACDDCGIKDSCMICKVLEK